MSPEDRRQRLLETLKLQRSVAPDQIKEWILQHDESFAMDDTELGRTDLVEHHVDTGDKAPVRQRATREPQESHLRCELKFERWWTIC